MGAPLTTRNAEIKTAAVEVRALTISGKQVTLAVFRQLRDEPLIAEDGTLNGVPWGTVNYHPNKCSDDVEHWHVVWQRGSELLRSRVRAKPYWDRLWPVSGRHLLASHVRDLLRSEGSELWGGLIPDCERTQGRTGVLFAMRDIPIGIEPTPATSKACAVYKVRIEAEDRALHESNPYVRYDSDEGRRSQWDYWDKVKPIIAAQVEGSLAELDMELGRGSRDSKWLLGKLHEEVEAEIQRRQTHLDIRTSLGDLPQLFIAV